MAKGDQISVRRKEAQLGMVAPSSKMKDRVNASVNLNSYDQSSFLKIALDSASAPSEPSLFAAFEDRHHASHRWPEAGFWNLTGS